MKKAGQTDGAAQLRLLCAWWAVTTVAAFTLSATKLPHYIAPAYPAMALLVGAYLGDPSAYPIRCGTLAKISAVAIVALAGLYAAVFAYLPKLAYAKRESLVAPGQGVDLGWSPVALAVLFGAMGAAFLAARLRRKQSQARSALAIGMIAVDLVIVTAFAPTAARFASAPQRDLARQAAQLVGPKGTIIAYDFRSSDLVFYARRRITFVGEDKKKDLARLTATSAPVAVLTKAAHAGSGDFPGFRIVDRQGRYVLMSKR